MMKSNGLKERLRDSPGMDASRVFKVAVDASCAPDLIQKYTAMQAENEQLKALIKERDKKTSALDKTLAKTKEDKAQLRIRVAVLQKQLAKVGREKGQAEKDKAALEERLEVCERERMTFAEQTKNFLALSSQLEKDVIWIRTEALTRLPRPPPMEPYFQPVVFKFKDAAELLSRVTEPFRGQTMNLVHLPPRSPPVHMPLNAYGQHGYWFVPPVPPPSDMPFHLFVEGAPEQWAYLGQYFTSPFVDGDMSIAEWSCLDFAAQHAYCRGLAAERLARDTATATDADAEVLTLRRKHDTGEMRVPCFYLRCVGFSMALHEALQACFPSAPMTPDMVFGMGQSYAPRWASMAGTG